MTGSPPRDVGRFVRGHHYATATEFLPGQRTSIATEFKAGQMAHNKMSVGTVRVRIETHTGLPRAWVKVAEPNVWRKRAVVVWEAVHGPLPRGSVVHHKDRDSLNDDLTNLVGLTRREHTIEHRAEYVAGMARAFFGKGWTA